MCLKHGRKLPKRVLFETPKPKDEFDAKDWRLTHCDKCFQEVKSYPIYRNGKVWCRECDPMRVSQLPVVQPHTIGSSRATWSDDTKIEGNLPDGDYRFWYGARTPSSEMRTCRACGKTMWRQDQAVAHKDDQSVIVNGLRCTERLVAAYKRLLKVHKCVICRQMTHYEKWGVPLCLPTSINDKCITTWKFVSGDCFALTMELMQDEEEEVKEMHKPSWGDAT